MELSRPSPTTKDVASNVDRKLTFFQVAYGLPDGHAIESVLMPYQETWRTMTVGVLRHDRHDCCIVA